MIRSFPLVVVLTGVLLAAKDLPAGEKDTASHYTDIANRLIDAALIDDAGLSRLEFLCYRIGHRLGGSASLQQAIDWSAAEMKRAGLENVRTIPVKLPHWVRGRESAEMLEPLQQPLFMLGLGRQHRDGRCGGFQLRRIGETRAQ